MEVTIDAGGGDAQTELLLSDPPLDGVTQLVYDSAGAHVLATSWDKSVGLWDANNGARVQKIGVDVPLLGCVFAGDDSRPLVSGADGSISQVHLNTGSTTVLGTHDSGARAICFHEQHGVVVSGGWDGMLKKWDTRKENPLITSVRVPGK
jgi:WD40 repeat protein